MITETYLMPERTRLWLCPHIRKIQLNYIIIMSFNYETSPRHFGPQARIKMGHFPTKSYLPNKLIQIFFFKENYNTRLKKKKKATPHMQNACDEANIYIYILE